MKILCTGSSGFIGTRLREKLSPVNEVYSFDIVDGQDLRDLRAVQDAVKGKDIVFHLAAIADLNWARVHPIETMKINVKGTWNVAQACTGAGAKLYFASTCCVYGNQEHHPADEVSLPNPAEIYACSKLAGESIIRGFYCTYGLQYNLMRFATVYGEGTRTALATHIFLGQALRGEPITVHGAGRQTRTLTHVDDLVGGILTLLESGRMNDVWNITAEEEVSALRMARDIKRITKSKSDIVFIPQRIGQTFRESLSAGKMHRETGWSAKVKWQDGIERMLQWFTETGQKSNVYQLPAENNGEMTERSPLRATQ